MKTVREHTCIFPITSFLISSIVFVTTSSSMIETCSISEIRRFSYSTKYRISFISPIMARLKLNKQNYNFPILVSIHAAAHILFNYSARGGGGGKYHTLSILDEVVAEIKLMGEGTSPGWGISPSLL